jgi:tetratricopeptide (TPR) repeat protein
MCIKDKAVDKNRTLYTLAKHLTLAGIAGLGLTMAPSGLSAWAADGLLHNIRFDQGSRHFLIDTTGPVKAMVNTLTIAGRKRVIIDLDNADIAGDLPRDAQLLEDLIPQLPGLKNVTVNQYGGNGRPIVRVLLDLQGEPGAIRLIQNQGPHIELELSDYAAASPSYDPPPKPPSKSARNLEYPPSLNRTPENDQPAPRTYQPAPTQTDRSTYGPSDWSSSTPTGTKPTDAGASTANALQLDKMKRTLVNMNQQYDQLLAENQSLKNKISSTSKGNASNQGEVNLLKGELRSLSARNNELNTELKALNSRNSEMQNRLTQALNADTGPRVDEMKRSLLEINRQYAQLKQDKLQQSQQMEQIKQDKLLQSQQLQQLALEKVSLTQQMAQLKNQLASKSSTPSSSTPQPSVSNTELQELHRQLSVAQQSVNDSLRTIKEQNQEMAYLRNQVNTVKAGMDDAAKEQITSLQTANEQKDAALIALRRQLSTTLSSSAGSSTNSTAQVASLKSQLDSMNRQHQTELQELNRQLQEKNTQIQGLNQQVTLANARQNDPTSKVDLQKRESRITELQQALYTANQQLANTQATQRELAATKAKLAQYVDTQEEASQTQQALAAAKTRIAQLQAGESQLVGTRQELTAVKAELERIKAQKNQGNPAAEKQQKETITRLNHENQQLIQQSQQMGAQLKAAQQQAAASQASSANPEQVSMLQKQVASLQQDLSAMKRQTEQAGQSQSELASLQQELSAMKRQADQASQEATRAKEELRTLQAKGKTTPTVASGGNANGNALLQKQVSDMNQQLANLRRENDDLRTNLASKPSASAKSAEANPDAEAAYQEGKTDLQAKKLPDALDKFKQALLLDPNNGRYTMDYSVALSEDQQYAEAIDVLRRYLQHNPLDRDAYNQLGKVYLLNDQADAANQSFIRAIPVSTLNNYATSLKKLGKMEDAENVFKLALGINPKDSEVLFNLGNLYNNQNKLELARNKYLEALLIRPDFAEAHYNLGLIFSKLGDNPKAVTHLEKFLQLSPNARNAETIRAYVQKLKV